RSFLQGRTARLQPAAAAVPVRSVRSRVGLTMLAFTAVYAMIGVRLVMLGLAEEAPTAFYITAQDAVAASRPDLVDRNGAILATDIKPASLFAEPLQIVDVDEAFEGLTSILPELRNDTIRRRLESGAGFVWLKRGLTPSQQQKIHSLGIPGVGFLEENSRFY